jgi:hypothetical protein
MKLCFVGQTGNGINRIITEVLRVLLMMMMMMMDGKNAQDFSATTRFIPKRQRQYIHSNLE